MAAEETGLTFDDYQEATADTAVYPVENHGIPLYPALGLVNEAGEVGGQVKKAWRDDGFVTDERRKAIKKELGDVLWYVARVAADLDIDLSECAQENLDKLRSRKERGVLQGSGDDR
jgi:NTP pyrophosphatase (non-canonical NTP hydrolase)